MSIADCRRMVSLSQRQRLRGVSLSLFKIDRIRSFDIRQSTVDIRFETRTDLAPATSLQTEIERHPCAAGTWRR
jgi:hypothetical protein